MSINKNNAIAFANRRIPYIPELRQYCESVTACILMTQLEYWFAAIPQGFYKFLSSCEKHKLYKKGDSWMEELRFSKEEFRNAFDNIGVRYRSKNLLDECINNGIDPFQGKPYLSYIDVKNGLTYYHRNDVVVNTIVNDALHQFNPVLEQLQPDHVIDSPEVKINNFQRSTNLTSRNRVSPFPYIKKHKITTKEDTAEQHNNSIENMTIEKNTAHVAVSAPFLSKQDLIIRNKLSSRQIEYVTYTVKQLQEEGGVLHLPASHAVNAITESLLSPKNYSNAGTNFLQKINTIKKAIKNNTWVPSIDYVLQTEAALEKQISDVKIKINHAYGNVEGIKRLIEYSPTDNPHLPILKKNLVEAERKYIDACNEHKKIQETILAVNKDDEELVFFSPNKTDREHEHLLENRGS